MDEPIQQNSMFSAFFAILQTFLLPLFLTSMPNANISAISWCDVPGEPLDVTANGYKHGATKKALGTPKARYTKKMNTKYKHLPKERSPLQHC